MQGGGEDTLLGTVYSSQGKSSVGRSSQAPRPACSESTQHCDVIQAHSSEIGFWMDPEVQLTNFDRVSKS